VKKEHIRKAVREGYAQIARGEQDSCCGPQPCGCNTQDQARTISLSLGYKGKDLKAVPEGANLGLGCGNPTALASLKKGETVVDLGAGAGFDCFLAARRVGAKGRVIGVDMTPEMIEKARQNADKSKLRNVEFRLGEIEHLPVADNTADVIISNCVINLVPDKHQAFKEAFRILKPGGRLIVSDIVLLRPLPDFVRKSVAAYVGCLSGAALKRDYLAAIRTAGFRDIRVVSESRMAIETMANDPTAKAIAKGLRLTQTRAKQLIGAVVSAYVAATKPGK
jgi:ubiquinone/menaquinone biosynthesis C-methylase UbiE